jgi:hypothetical protein
LVLEINAPDTITQSLTIGQTITSEVSQTGEQDTYTFTGKIGQKIWFDSLEYSNSEIYVTIYAPNGDTVFSQRVRDDREPAFLPQNGEYRLVIDGSGRATGTYQFRLLDLAQGTPLTLGNAVTGNFGNSQREAVVYTLNGVEGDTLYFDRLNGDPNNYYYLYKPNGDRVFSERLDRDYELTLTETGKYSLVLSGFDNPNNNYELNVISPDLFTVPLTLGQPISANISQKGEKDAYTFDGELGQKLFFDGLIGNSNLKARLYAPSGKLAVDDDTDGNWTPFTLTETGKYRLEIDGVGETTGVYSFVLSDRAQSPNITLGTQITGTTASDREVQFYQLNGKAGQVLKFDLNSVSAKIPYILTNPLTWTDAQTQAQALGGNLVSINNAAENQYLVNLFGSSELFWIGTTDQAEEGNWQWISGEPVTYTNWLNGQPDNANNNEDYAIFNWDGAGRWNDLLGNYSNYRGIIELNNVNSITPTTLNTWIAENWVIYDANNNVIASPNRNNPDFTVALPSDGLYTLAILGNNFIPTNYSFQVSDITPTTVTPTQLGTLQSGSLTTTGQVANYSFTGNAGTQIYLDSISSSNGNIRYKLLNPDGTEAFTNHDSRFDREPFVLQQTGNYTLQAYNATGNYSFKLLNLPIGLGAGVNYLEIGNAVSGTRNNDAIVYTFEATEGLPILFNGIAGTNLTANLYDPNGQRVFSNYNFQSNDYGVYNLTQEGWYHLVIAGNEAIDRPYQFQLLALDIAPDLTFNLPINGSLATGQVSQAYRFEGKAGETFFLDAIQGNTTNRWKLYDPAYKIITDTLLNSDFEEVLPTTGTYTLVATGSTSATPVTYQFRAFTHDAITPDIVTPGTGEDSTNNTGDSLGIFAVQLQVEDDRGGVALQDYRLQVWADPTNNNPVILSQPVTRYGLDDEVYRYQVRSIDPDNDTLRYRLVNAPLGSLIDQDTGELLWFPENAQVGDKGNFTVEVSDGRGGKDTQTFTVDVFGKLGTIQGAVFDDLNGNGFLYTKLFKGDDPSIVLAIDVSGSTQAPFYGSRKYPNVKTVLDAEVAASLAVVDSIIAQGLGDKIKIALIPHRNTVTLQDMDPATAGVQVYTTALADADNNGIADVRQILQSYQPFGSNNFNITLDAIETLVTQLPGDPNVIFMSDGYDLAFERDPQLGQAVIDHLRNSGINLNAFAVGEASTLKTIQRIDPDAERITDIEQLVRIFSGFDPRYALEPIKENVTVYLDLNNNGTFDLSEPSQLTKKDESKSVLGQTNYYYTFDQLLPGTYTVRQVVPNGYVQTTPLNDYVDTITVNGETFTHLLGVHLIDDKPSNSDPTFLTNAPTVTLRAGESLFYQAIAQDPDADPLTYKVVLNPNGMTVNPQTGEVVWTPTKQQVEKYYQELAQKRRELGPSRAQFAETTVSFNVLLTADDGRGCKALQYVNVTVLPDNFGPLFTSTPLDKLTPQVGKPFEYQAKALNSDNDPITYSLAAGTPLGITIDGETGLVTWTPAAAQVGEQKITIIATDTQGATAKQLLPLKVIVGIPNNDPVITSTPRITARIDTAYIYQVVVEDKDNNPIDYTLLDAPQGMVIDEQERIFWIPSAADLGEANVTVKVNDGQGVLMFNPTSLPCGIRS